MFDLNQLDQATDNSRGLAGVSRIMAALSFISLLSPETVVTAAAIEMSVLALTTGMADPLSLALVVQGLSIQSVSPVIFREGRRLAAAWAGWLERHGARLTAARVRASNGLVPA